MLQSLPELAQNKMVVLFDPRQLHDLSVLKTVLYCFLHEHKGNLSMHSAEPPKCLDQPPLPLCLGATAGVHKLAIPCKPPTRPTPAWDQKGHQTTMQLLHWHHPFCTS